MTEGGHSNTRGRVWNLEPEAGQAAEHRGPVLDLTTSWGSWEAFHLTEQLISSHQVVRMGHLVTLKSLPIVLHMVPNPIPVLQLPQVTGSLKVSLL